MKENRAVGSTERFSWRSCILQIFFSSIDDILLSDDDTNNLSKLG